MSDIIRTERKGQRKTHVAEGSAGLLPHAKSLTDTVQRVRPIRSASLIFQTLSWNSDTGKCKSPNDSPENHSVPFALGFIDKSTAVNVPFGGSRLFSANTQTNRNDYNGRSGGFSKRVRFVSASECRRQRKKKKRALMKGRKARRLGAEGCAAWKVIGGTMPSKVFG